VGLDVYVGTLTRYFSGDWETAVQQAANAAGSPVEVIRAPPADAVTDPVALRSLVTAWQRSIARDFSASEQSAEPWDESPNSPYFTDKPGWDGYAGLVLLTAYTLYPERIRPDKVPADPDSDPVYRAYSGTEPAGLTGLFAQKLGPPMEGRRSYQITDPMMWLPIPFDATVIVSDLLPEPIRVGSSVTLLSQLEELNRRTYRADRETMAAWLREDPDDSFDQAARRGLAIFTDLARKSVDQCLPMKLDF
jgi:hypothetical protein